MKSVLTRLKCIIPFFNKYNYSVFMNISRTLTATLAAAFTLPALADIPASRVPAPVKEQVQKQYPNAGAIEWDFDNDEDVYEAEFHLNGLEYEVKLYPDGTVSLG